MQILFMVCAGIHCVSLVKQVFCSSLQIRPLSIAKWRVTPRPGTDVCSFIALPNQKKSSLVVGMELSVCILGIAACHCALFRAYEEGIITVPEGEDIEDLSSTSESECLSGVDEDDFRFEYLQKYYPACVKKKEVCLLKIFSYIILSIIMLLVFLYFI